jgi:DNA end-binding protein Ku
MTTMAQQAYWKGWLKLSLVTCKIALIPAASDRDKLRFHVLNRRTGNRIVTRYVDEATGKWAPEENEARAWQSGEDSFVLIEDEELDAIALETVRTIDIDSFVPRDAVAWVYLDKPHYVVPDDEVGAEAFAVIREAMSETETAALSRLALQRREYRVLLEPRGLGFMLWTLRNGDEVRHFEGGLTADGDPGEEALALVHKLIEAKLRRWSPDLVKDPVQQGLLQLISDKTRKAPARKREREPEAPAGNVVNIVDALRRSLSAARRDKDGRDGKG